MALTYRTGTYGGANVPLTNVQIDENFSWLNNNKLSTAGGTVGSLIISGDLTVNGQSTTINATNIAVDDKNIELAAVASFPVIANGAITTGNAIVKVIDTTGMIPGQTIAITGGTGALGANPRIASVDSSTQVTLTVNHVTGGTPITYSVGGASIYTANGGGITVRGDTDKLLRFDADFVTTANSNWYSSENINIASGKVYKIGNTSVLTDTALGSSVLSSSLTSVGILTNLTVTNTISGSVNGNAATVTTNANLTGDVTSVGNNTTLSNTTVTAGSYGSSTSIPSFTVDAKGRITAASGNSISVGDGALTISSVTAAPTNNTVTLTLSGSYSANSTTSRTLDLKVGPALTGLASTMTGAGSGFIKKTGADSYTVDTNTYLTSYTNTTYDVKAVTTTGGALVRLTGSDATTDDIMFASGTNITVEYSDDNTITISAGAATTIVDDTFTNTTYYPLLSTSTSGNLTTSQVSSTKLTFNSSTGDLGATNFNSLSDARFKKDLEQISGALGKVKQLTGYTYTLIEENVRSSGLTAQDVELVLPEAVGGNDERKTLAYGNMMGLIVEAIKELDAKLEYIQSQLSINK